MKRWSVVVASIGLTVVVAWQLCVSPAVAAQERKPKQAEARREVRQSAHQTARQTRQHVEQIVKVLDEPQRELAAHDHDPRAIREISLFPGHRVGVRLGDLNERQQAAIDRLLAEIFTREALTRIHEVFKQGSGQGDYYFARFWDGDRTDPLTWRVEGHHFSSTVFIDADDWMHPGTMLIGGQGDVWKPLDEKVRALFASLDDGQKQRVMLTDAPRRTGTPPFKDTVDRPGLAWKDLSTPQKQKARQVIKAFRDLFAEGVLFTSQRAFRRAGGLETLHFVYAGSPGELKGEYHFGVSGGADTHFEFDTRDGHVHMMLHFGDPRRVPEEDRGATKPTE